MTDEPRFEHPTDQLRLCPTCRMPISVLATRCRHCGAEVARPRKKEASLTIHDLGGDHKNTYRPSGNVMEAIEAFRAEVQNAETPIDPMTSMGDGGMPQLDEHSQAMLSAVLGDEPTPTPTPRRGAGAGPANRAQRAGIPNSVVWGGLTAIGVLFLAWGAQVALSVINQGPAETQQYLNPAPEMIARGEDPLAVLEAAVQALQVAHNEQNQTIMSEARRYVLDEVDSLLTAIPWEAGLLEKASRISNQAVRIDPHTSLRSLRERVLNDVTAYSMKLKIDAENGTVVLDYRDPAIPDETGGVNDLLGGRFLIKSISQHQVRLEDTLVKGPGGNRLIVYWMRDGRFQGL